MYYIVSSERTLYGALTDPDKEVYSNFNILKDRIEDGKYVHTIDLRSTTAAIVERNVSFTEIIP